MEIVFVGLVLGVAVLAAVGAVKIYRLGLADAAAGFVKAAPHKAVKNTSEAKLDPEIEKLNRILQNVEKYDGSATGQSKIDD